MNCRARRSVTGCCSAVLVAQGSATARASTETGRCRGPYAIRVLHRRARALEAVLKTLEEFQVDRRASLRARPISSRTATGSCRSSTAAAGGSAAAAERKVAGAQSGASVRTARARTRSRKTPRIAEALCNPGRLCEVSVRDARALARQAVPTASRCARRTALAPDNPRVQLDPGVVRAECDGGSCGDERWRAVVASFEAAPPSRPGKPDGVTRRR